MEKIVLDAGCGTGLLLDYIIKHFYQEKSMIFFYVGTDISINMLKSFELKLENKNKKVKRRINLLLADLENLPIRNNIFDEIFSLTSLQNLPNIAEGFNETLRVVKNSADLKFTILKKTLDFHSFLSSLKPRMSEIMILNNENIEDIIVQGKAFKG